MNATILTGQNPTYSLRPPSAKPSQPLQSVASKSVITKCKFLTMQIHFPCCLEWLLSQCARSAWNPRSNGFSCLKYGLSMRSRNSKRHCYLFWTTLQLPLQLSKYLQDLLITLRKFCLWIYKHETNGSHLHLATGWTSPLLWVTFNF